MAKPKICACCGREFTPKVQQTKYCSEECKKEVKKQQNKACYEKNGEKYKEKRKEYYEEVSEWLRSKRKPKICPVCGEEFYNSKDNRRLKYCSAECADIAQHKIMIEYHRSKSTASPTFVCKNCGNLTVRTGPNQLYCHDCKKEVLNKYRADYFERAKDEKEVLTKTCKLCGKEFTTTDRRRVYCSNECSSIAGWHTRRSDPQYIANVNSYNKQRKSNVNRFLERDRKPLKNVTKIQQFNIRYWYEGGDSVKELADAYYTTTASIKLVISATPDVIQAYKDAYPDTPVPLNITETHNKWLETQK